MASNEQSVTLLRRNKRAQVEALNDLGFNLTESARAADFPMYVKWASGLLDLAVAANRISDNKKFFFSLEEWQSLSATEQGKFLLRGIRVRAYAKSFIVAPDTIMNKQFGASDVSCPDLHSYSQMMDLYFYDDAYTETRLISEGYAAAGKTDVIGAPAADAALAYKAFTLDSDGLEDDSQWCLPTPAHLMIMFRCINEIDAIFTAVWSSDFKINRSAHWSCGKYSNNNVYRLSVQNGGTIWAESPTNAYSVRPICLS